MSGFETERIADHDAAEPTGDDAEEAEDDPEVQNRWVRVIHQLKRDRLALTGMAVVVVMLFVAVFSRPIVVGDVTVQPLSLTPYDPAQTGVGDRYDSPSLTHPMGTDRLGRDTFSRVVAGSRYSVTIGFVVTALAASFGVIYGGVSGYFGGTTDGVMMRLVDVIFAFPALVLAMILVSLFGGGFIPLVGAFALVGWASYARIIRGEILKVKQNEYVMAAKALGARDKSVLFRHIIPNAIAPVVVQATLSIGTVVIGVAALGFLGLGFDPGTPEWGTMLDAERDTLITGAGGTWFWWTTVFPGMMIFLFVMSINMVGDAVNDALDVQVDDVRGGGG